MGSGGKVGAGGGCLRLIKAAQLRGGDALRCSGWRVSCWCSAQSLFGLKRNDAFALPRSAVCCIPVVHSCQHLAPLVWSSLTSLSSSPSIVYASDVYVALYFPTFGLRLCLPKGLISSALEQLGGRHVCLPLRHLPLIRFPSDCFSAFFPLEKFRSSVLGCIRRCYNFQEVESVAWWPVHQ